MRHKYIGLGNALGRNAPAEDLQYTHDEKFDLKPHSTFLSSSDQPSDRRVTAKRTNV